MSDESVEPTEGLADVTELSMRQLDDIDDVQRYRAVQQAFPNGRHGTTMP